MKDLDHTVGTNTHTSHAIVGESFTELIPHNKEHRKRKLAQLPELLERVNTSTETRHNT